MKLELTSTVCTTQTTLRIIKSDRWETHKIILKKKTDWQWIKIKPYYNNPLID